MDILKILSLGTRKTSKTPSAPVSNAANLPSAGGRVNAQLFHDDVATRGTKRKCEAPDPDDVGDAQVGDVNFFAPHNDAKGVSTKTHQPTPKASEKQTPAPQPKLLDEDECKHMLRSHRLKFTLLSAGAAKKAKVKKNKKKAKAVEEVKQTKKQLHQLHPQPLSAFGDLRSTYHISSRLADNLEAQGYKEPTEVQMASLPLLLDSTVALSKTLAENLSSERVDFMAVAPTGSGKTISFLIPAINRVMKRRSGAEDRKTHSLEAIVLAPTRELANQIHNEGRKLTVGTGIKVVAMKKGMRIFTDDGQLQDEKVAMHDRGEDSSDAESEVDDDTTKPVTKADILVTTPMILLHFLNRGTSRKTLSSVHSLILDEADVLLDELFRDQTTGIWSACTSPDLHVTFWSATMGSNIETIITEQLKGHADTRNTALQPLIRLIVGLKDAAVPNISHKLIYTATETGKLLALRQLLHPGTDSGPPLRPPFLVFTQTIDRATALHNELKYDIPLEAGGAARLAVLHSLLPDAARADIMRRFRRGDVWVLITTDVLARGVDLAGVNGVVNYDVPASAAAYVHRAGRTGRAGRAGGVAVTFYTRDDIPIVKSVANVIAASERQAGRTGDRADVQKWLLDALPTVGKGEKKKQRMQGGVAARKTAKITSRSAWERRREKNRRGAMEGSTGRKARDREQAEEKGGESEWDGLDD